MIDKNATNHGFTCLHCHAVVPPARTTARNHCNQCLYSMHVDSETPGDRASTCGGLMRPAAIYQKKDSFVIIHECETCGHERPNKALEDDNYEGILDLSVLTNKAGGSHI